MVLIPMMPAETTLPKYSATARFPRAISFSSSMFGVIRLTIRGRTTENRSINAAPARAPASTYTPAHPIPASAPDRDALCASIGILSLLNGFVSAYQLSISPAQRQDPVIHQGAGDRRRHRKLPPPENRHHG